jgi:hypothetical protein
LARTEENEQEKTNPLKPTSGKSIGTQGQRKKQNEKRLHRNELTSDLGTEQPKLTIE